MSGRYRTYRGIHGERIRVPEASFATVPKLHAEPQQFPFARMAAALGPLRDRFASAASFGVLLEETLARCDVQRMLSH
jgi:hypothetical protein